MLCCPLPIPFTGSVNPSGVTHKLSPVTYLVVFHPFVEQLASCLLLCECVICTILTMRTIVAQSRDRTTIVRNLKIVFRVSSGLPAYWKFLDYPPRSESKHTHLETRLCKLVTNVPDDKCIQNKSTCKSSLLCCTHVRLVAGLHSSRELGQNLHVRIFAGSVRRFSNSIIRVQNVHALHGKQHHMLLCFGAPTT